MLDGAPDARAALGERRVEGLGLGAVAREAVEDDAVAGIVAPTSRSSSIAIVMSSGTSWPRSM